MPALQSSEPNGVGQRSQYSVSLLDQFFAGHQNDALGPVRERLSLAGSFFPPLHLMQHRQHVRHGLSSASLSCQVNCFALGLLLEKFPHTHLLNTTRTSDLHLLQLIHHLFREPPLTELRNGHFFGFFQGFCLILHGPSMLVELLVHLMFVKGGERESLECSDDSYGSKPHSVWILYYMIGISRVLARHCVWGTLRTGMSSINRPSDILVPKEKLEIKSVRSSGPGG